MTVSELYSYLDSAIPAALSCDWDNDGLMCCPDTAREVKKVLFTLDVTGAAAEYAALQEEYSRTYSPLTWHNQSNSTTEWAWGLSDFPWDF